MFSARNSGWVYLVRKITCRIPCELLATRLAIQQHRLLARRSFSSASLCSVLPMPDAGKKRSSDEEDEPSGSKKSRGDGDSKDSAVHVYQPCVVLPELAGKMNSLVEVRLRALILGALHVSPPAF